MATKKPKQEGVPVPTVVIVSIVLFVAGLLIGKFTLSTAKECEEASCPEKTVRYRIYPRGSNPSKGPRNAKVTVVQVTDFQNPLAKVMSSTLQKLQEKYPKDVRIVFVNNPRSADGRKAAIAALAANKQGKFWKMHDKLFSHRGKLTDPKLESMAKSVGMNIEKFKADMKNRRLSSLVAFDQRQVRRLGVKKTPSIFINGRYLPGKVPIKKLEKIVKEEVKAADKLVASMKKEGKTGRRGQRLPNIYREFMRSARTSLAKSGHKGRDKNPRNKRRRQRPQEDPNAIYKISTEGKPYKGAKDALVTILESSEFQCPFCNRVNPTLKKIMETYKGKVKIVFHHNPLGFHKQAMAASIAATEIYKQKGDKAFWTFHDKIFANQGKIRSEGEAFLIATAKKIGGIDMAKFKKALKEKTHKVEIDKTKRVSMDLGARGTPTFFINGRKVRGARPFPAFKKVIDEELKKAEASIKAGKANKSNYYASVMKKGLTKVKYLPGKGPKKPRRRNRKRRIVDPTLVYKMPIEDKPFKGAKDALVTIVLSTEFQCPFSKRVTPTLARIVKEYPKKVKIVFHNNPLPFHKQAMMAAEAAWEAYQQKGDKAFWTFHDKMFANQGELRKDGRAFVEKLAKEVGLNMTKFKKALDQHTHKKVLDEQRLLSNKLGARGTPSCFINGKIFTGARPYAAFKQRVEQAIKKAKPLVSKAGGLKKLYAYIIKDGKTKAVYKTIGGDSGKKKAPGPRAVRRPKKIRLRRAGAIPRTARKKIKAIQKKAGTRR